MISGQGDAVRDQSGQDDSAANIGVDDFGADTNNLGETCCLDFIGEVDVVTRVRPRQPQHKTATRRVESSRKLALICHQAAARRVHAVESRQALEYSRSILLSG
jgi:hypothetical protein